MKQYLVALPGCILFLLGIIGGIVIFKPKPDPIIARFLKESNLHSLPNISYIPSQALRLTGHVIKGSLSYQPIDQNRASTISATFTLRQGDSIATKKNSFANIVAEGISLSVLESTELGASSLLPQSLLFTLLKGTIDLTTSIPVSVRAGISLIRVASGSATLSYIPGESISLSVSQGSASGAFVDATNETLVYNVSQGKTLILDPTSQTAKIK